MKGKRLKEMCHWMGSYFHDCVDYNGGCIFNTVIRMGLHIFRMLGVKKLPVRRDLKMGIFELKKVGFQKVDA